MLHNPKLLQCDEGGHFTEEDPVSRHPRFQIVSFESIPMPDHIVILNNGNFSKPTANGQASCVTSCCMFTTHQVNNLFFSSFLHSLYDSDSLQLFAELLSALIFVLLSFIVDYW